MPVLQKVFSMQMSSAIEHQEKYKIKRKCHTKEGYSIPVKRRIDNFHFEEVVELEIEDGPES